MSGQQNIVLLKSQPKYAIDFHGSQSDIKAACRRNQATIGQLNKRIEIKRNEIKALSKSVNTLIDKQLKKTVKQRPCFTVTYSSPKLNALNIQKNKVFAAIQSIKQQIKAQQIQQPEFIVKEVFANKAKLQQLLVDTEGAQQSKRLLTSLLQENKQRLDKLKQNNCIVDLEKKQAQFQNVRQNCKKIQKQINSISGEQLLANAYYFEIKTRLQKQVIEQKIEVEVSYDQIKQLITQINKIYQERNNVQKQVNSKIKKTEKIIEQIEKSIKNYQNLIREANNNVLRVSLQSKRMKSMVLLRNDYHEKKNILRQQIKEVPPLIKPNPEQKKNQKRVINKIYMIQKDDANCLYIGQWNQDIKQIHDSKISSSEHIKTLVFYFKQGRIIAVKSVNVDKNGNLIELKDNLDNLEFQMKIDINLDQVVHLQYSTKSDELYLRFYFSNGSWKQLGRRSFQVQKINLEQYFIKSVEIQSNQISGIVKGLRILLEQKPNQQKLSLSYVGERTSSQMSYSNLETIGKKKVVLKGRSLKKINEEPIVDHRLLLTRRK